MAEVACEKTRRIGQILDVQPYIVQCLCLQPVTDIINVNPAHFYDTILATMLTKQIVWYGDILIFKICQIQHKPLY